MSELVFQIQQVSKSFHVATTDVPVLKNISFDIKAKDFVVIFGPSGCGKSTLLHTMLGLEEPTSGKVLFLGKNLYDGATEDERSDFRKQHAGMVYQQPNWIKALTVVENVAFPLYLLGVERSEAIVKAGQILRNLRLDRFVNYLPSELSSGQQQKVALARALITNPEVIIADEPTGNLDYESGRELMEMLSELNRSGQTIIMVTHDLDYLKYAKTAIRIFDGKFIKRYEGTENENLQKVLQDKRGDEELHLMESNGEKSKFDRNDFNDTIIGYSTRNFGERKVKIFNKKTSFPNLFFHLVDQTAKLIGFFILLLIYLLNYLIGLKNFKRIPTTFFAGYRRLVKFLTKRFDNQSNSPSRLDLIDLAVRNMKAKKTRTIVTIGGMMIGIGAIVFLVSIGYGLQQLVVTRVARLEEMRQADVAPQAGGKVKIDDKTLENFKDITAVEMSLPLIAVVGRVNYQNSVSDMAVYGVTTDYLKQSAIKPAQGKIFESNELTAQLPVGQVAGVSTESEFVSVGEKIQDVDFTIDSSAWIRIRENASTNAKILGYTRRVEGNSSGEEIWGGTYPSEDNAGKAGETEDGKKLGKWLKAPVLLWQEQVCDPETQGDCEEDGKHLVLRNEDGKQAQVLGYFAEINVTVTGTVIKQAQVLGVTSDDHTPSLDWVEIASEAGIVQTPDTKTTELSPNAKKQAVVNRAMLKVLGINENEAVRKKFTASFVVVGDLLTDPEEKIESSPAEYTITGVTPDEKTPVFYVPFVDLRSLGITNYSQVKVVVKDQADLSKARRQIEAMGYVTRSVSDTVAQINSLFATAKTILALLGMVALAVAALGMFNTLTVSLLERTREVGLMKAMGMKSSEVQELFLTESMIMGFFGGILGIIIGFIAGKLTGVVISLFAIFKGVGLVDISYVPLSLILVIIFLSLLVGIATGIYPAKRATKISALNALRYE